MQIAFVTLLLGLTSGLYPIEVTVSGPVAAVEVVLDGAPAARIAGPPWKTQVDFGPGLSPHEMVARALDAEGNEVARAVQWVNLPRPPAEVGLLIERDPEGRPTAARLTWQSLTGAEPAAITLTFDGRELAVDAAGRAALPAHDPEVAHVLTAELVFSPTVSARRDVVFGGAWGSEVSTELTAVPVRQRKRAKMPPPERLEGWFTAGGQPLSVAAVEEEEPALVVVLRVPGASEVYDKLDLGKKRWAPREMRFQLQTDLRYEMKLGKEDEVRFLSIGARSYQGTGVPSELFDMSRGFTAKDGGVAFLLSRVDFPGSPERRIADAVAVAGLQALTGNRRRAVVLLLDGSAADASRYDAAAVRRYLESIRVPLLVWSLEGAKSPAAEAWGQVEDVSSLRKLYQAVERLQGLLEEQRIVWVEGRHLPRAVALSPAASGVELLEDPVGGAGR